MNCPHCTVSIHEEDHRCSNCGRRLGHGSGPLLATRSALALQLETVATTYAEPVAGPRLEHSNPKPAGTSPRHSAVLQSSLFAIREAQKIMSITGETATPAARRARKQPVAKSSYLPHQGVLEFVPSTAPVARTLPTSVEAVIYCDYPVATRMHRFLAGLIDLGIVAACMALFMTVLVMGCEGMPWLTLDLTSMAAIGVATGLLGFLYEAYWVISGVPSPGMEWAGLRLVHFDGHEPRTSDNGLRIIGGVLSVFAAFIGIAWAFVDEECLTWQDHISRTFPTPVRAQYGVRQ
jgi:uncharacterized RDD family membrane protein YckC